MLIKFLRNLAGNPGYKMGEIADIDEAEAKRFIGAGYAEEVNPTIEEKQTATNKTFDKRQKR